MKSGLLTQALIVASVTALLLLGAEFGLRWLSYPPAGAPPFSMDLAAPDSDIGFKAYGNALWYFDTTPNGGPVVREIGTTDANGYRPSLENADCATCPYIVVVGDSATFDAEASDRNTWTEFLARDLSAHGRKYKVLNVSFRGWSAIQVAEALKKADLAGKKIDYVIYLEVPNDPIENIKIMYDLPAPLATEENGRLDTRLVVPNASFYDNPGKRAIEDAARKLSLTTLAYSLGGKKLAGLNDAPQPIPASDGDYRKFWPPGMLDKIREEYIGLLLGKGKDAGLAAEAFGRAIQDMAKTSQELGATFIVAPVPFGPYTRGGNAKEFAALLGVPMSRVDAFLDDWDAYNRAVRHIANANHAEVLDINQNLFAGMSYREYAAVPHDWHFSVKANERLAREVSEKLRKKMR